MVALFRVLKATMPAPTPHSTGYELQSIRVHPAARLRAPAGTARQRAAASIAEIMALADGSVSEEALAEWIRRHVTPDR